MCCEIVHLPPPSGRNASEHEDGHGETRGCRLQAGSRFFTALRLFNDENNPEAGCFGQEYDCLEGHQIEM